LTKRRESKTEAEEMAFLRAVAERQLLDPKDSSARIRNEKEIVVM
jgi:hypothetical protein